MKKWLKDRFGEPTSFLALAGAIQFIGMMTKDDHLPAVANAVAQNASALAGGDYITAGINVLTGLALALGFAKREKGSQ